MYDKIMVSLVVALFLALGFEPAMAQIPTTVPAEVTTNIDNAITFIGAAGAAVLGVISVMALIKWIRGVLF